MKSFVAAYRKKFNNKTPDAMAILGYDSAKLLADAIKRAGDSKPKSIRDALAATRGFHGVGGDISMDANRNAQKPIVVLQIVDGKYTFVSSVKPGD
jgi:branched-chain amino acid transport system substrate-binding protein